MPATLFRCLVLTLLLAGGCHRYGMLVKRESELNCPTDIRKTVPWCAGEDAIFRCPCGPSSNFYGHKPTCWRNWPLPGAKWRDAYCPPLEPENPECQEYEYEYREAAPLEILPDAPSAPIEPETPIELETPIEPESQIEPKTSSRGNADAAPIAATEPRQITLTAAATPTPFDAEVGNPAATEPTDLPPPVELRQHKNPFR